MTNFAPNSWRAWRDYCDRPLATPPPRLTNAEYKSLSSTERESYNEERHHFHANIPPISHPELERVHSTIELVRRTNPNEGFAARNAIVIDGPPTLGKTTTVIDYARTLDRDVRRKKGNRTQSGRHRLPVVRVGLSGNPSMKDLSIAFSNVLGLPDRGSRITQNRLTSAVIDELSEVEAELVIFDDIHCVNPGTRDGAALGNLFKRMADDIAGTCIFIGVDLGQRGFYNAGQTSSTNQIAQITRRWTLIEPRPFSITNATGRDDWGSIVTDAYQSFVLLDGKKKPSKVEIEIAFERSGGSIGSLLQLLTRSAYLAITSGQEQLTAKILRAVPVDISAQAGQNDRAAEVKAVRQQLKKEQQRQR